MGGEMVTLFELFQENTDGLYPKRKWKVCFDLVARMSMYVMS